MCQATFVLAIIFLVHHDLSSARQISSSFNKQQETSDELAVTHVRQKRGLFSAISAGLTIASWSSYGVSLSSSIYHAIRRCEDYRPKPCKHPTCQYISPCPDFLCQSSEKNKDYVDQSKVKMKAALDEIDALVLHALQLEVNGKNANINNEQILNHINTINGNLDRLASGIVSVDGGLSEKFKTKSLEILKMVQDKRTTVDQIVASPTMKGIFDEWTWDGTGRFVFSVALTVGYGIYLPLKERYAINKLYKEMRADFQNKFEAQRTAANPHGFAQPKIHNKFAYVQGFTTKQIQSQIKSAAKAIHKSNKAHQTQGFVSKAVGPIVNGLYTAMSVWSVYKQIDDCQKITNDMQETALNATGTRDQIEKIKVTEVLQLIEDIYKQTWEPAKDLLTNDTILDLLEGIKNLTVEANFTDTSPADTITSFLANIGSVSSSSSGTLSLQKNLIQALDTIEFRFRCIANKQHAIAVVINDCKSGRDTLNVLHSEADLTYDLNTKSCVEKKIVANTTLQQLQDIISAVATEKGWYGHCLLNNKALLYRVCSERAKGYTRPADIVAVVNKSALTQDMVSNFVTRCPPPEITPKSKVDTCQYYCLYQTNKQIAKSVGLLEYQVKSIIPSCGICSVEESKKTQICYSHFCEGKSAANIEPVMRLPLSTVTDVINNCVQKCVLKESEKHQVCQQLKCMQYNSNTVASSLNFPLASVEELKPQCDSIVQKCIISDQDKRYILSIHCFGQRPASEIQKSVGLPLQDVESVIKSQKCEDFLKEFM